MAMSMTGYGMETIHIEQAIVTVEIRSVNHRFLDFTPKIPRSMLSLEEKIRKVITSNFNRGRIEVYIGMEGTGFVEKTLQTDWELMDQYIDQLEKAKKRYRLSGEIPVTILTSMPDLLSIQEKEQKPDGFTDSIIMAVGRACEQVTSMRKEEGRFLIDDIYKRMKSIQDMLSLVDTRRKYVIEAYRERIQQRIDEALDDKTGIDASRIHQEIALLAEKGDISEEITRLHSHIDHFYETINEDEAIGRKLDFIIQEMHRETNTIGSKSTDSKISEWTVALKSDIEKIKEQVQNIE